MFARHDELEVEYSLRIRASFICFLRGTHVSNSDGRNETVYNDWTYASLYDCDHDQIYHGIFRKSKPMVDGEHKTLAMPALI